jgi:hypothetical protein
MNLLSPQKVGDLLTCDSFNITPTSLIVNSIRDGGGGRCHVFEEVARKKKKDWCHVRPSVRMELGFHWTDFDEILYLSFCRKPVMKIQVSLTSTKNNRYFI